MNYKRFKNFVNKKTTLGISVEIDFYWRNRANIIWKLNKLCSHFWIVHIFRCLHFHDWTLFLFLEIITQTRVSFNQFEKILPAAILHLTFNIKRIQIHLFFFLINNLFSLFSCNLSSLFHIFFSLYFLLLNNIFYFLLSC